MEALLTQPWTILPPPHPWRLRLRFPHSSPSSSSSSSRFCVCFSTKYRPWDSNAETIRSQKFNYNFTGEDEEEDTGGPRRWWSDEPSDKWEEEDDDDEEEPTGTFEQAIDAFWIFKVFRSYGWALPPIILSLLLSTGPKAFLMALALPLAQSVFSLAFDQLQKMTETRPKRRSRTKKKKPFKRPASKAAANEEEDRKEKKKTGEGYSYDYQSWVAGNSDSGNKGGNGAPKFGGWGDDLDRGGSVQRKTVERGKMSRKRRDRKSGTPLLLRLLIAVFPFLGSWTRML